MIKRITQHIKSETGLQVIELYGSTILQLLLGIVVSIIVARALKPEQYGHYSYLSKVFYLVVLIISTGHFVSMSKMLANSHDERVNRELLGTCLLLTGVLSILYSIGIFFYSFFQDAFFQDKLGSVIRIFSIVVIMYPVQHYLENVLMGLNRIRELALVRTLPRILYVLSLAVFVTYMELTYTVALILLLTTSYVIDIFQICRLRPLFSNIRHHWKQLSSENHQYGIHVYWGSLAGVASINLCALSISYFSGNKEFGYYNLALSVSEPLMLLPNVIATTLFRKFADMEMIPAIVIRSTLALSAVSYILFFLFVNKLIILLYSRDYEPSIFLTYILGFGAIVHGLGDVYNRFLCAKGKGKEVRNGAFISGFVAVTAFLILVPLLNSLGAAIARLTVAVCYLSAMFFFYSKARKDIIPST